MALAGDQCCGTTADNAEATTKQFVEQAFVASLVTHQGLPEQIPGQAGVADLGEYKGPGPQGRLIPTLAVA